MATRLAHVGIAVRNVRDASSLFSKLLGVPAGGVEEVPGQKVKTIFLPTEGGTIELLEPTSPDSTIARFLERRGEGVHHLSFEVDDVMAEITRLERLGFVLVDKQPRPGVAGSRVAFLHPKSTSGVLIEICEKSNEGHGI